MKGTSFTSFRSVVLLECAVLSRKSPCGSTKRLLDLSRSGLDSSERPFVLEKRPFVFGKRPFVFGERPFVFRERHSDEQPRPFAMKKRSSDSWQRSRGNEKTTSLRRQRPSAKKERSFAKRQRSSSNEERSDDLCQRSSADKKRASLVGKKATAKKKRSDVRRQRSPATRKRSFAKGQRFSAKKQRPFVEQQRWFPHVPSAIFPSAEPIVEIAPDIPRKTTPKYARQTTIEQPPAHEREFVMDEKRKAWPVSGVAKVVAVSWTFPTSCAVVSRGANAVINGCVRLRPQKRRARNHACSAGIGRCTGSARSGATDYWLS
jgi:hypothetical protein